MRDNALRVFRLPESKKVKSRKAAKQR
jgi:hypothetical protein